MFTKRTTAPITVPDGLIKELKINGMTGRMAYLPAKKKGAKTIVFLHGQHAAIERYWSTLEFLNDYGEVIMPDMPGYGGMTSFYKIGKKPTYDNYADYLYTFLKTQKLTKDIWLMGNSWGLQNMTRMFQKYPETQDWVAQPIGLAGFGAGSDFHVTTRFRVLLFMLIYPASTWLGSKLLGFVAFNRVSIKVLMAAFSKAKAKMQSDDSNLKKDMVYMEEYLWTVNDHRTHATTAISMFRDDLRRYSKEKIHLKLHNVVTAHDQYFNNAHVRETMEDLYDSYQDSPLDLHVHNPSMIATKEDVAALIPEQTKKLLLK